MSDPRALPDQLADLIEAWVDGLSWRFYPGMCVEVLIEFPWMWSLGEAS